MKFIPIILIPLFCTPYIYGVDNNDTEKLEKLNRFLSIGNPEMQDRLRSVEGKRIDIEESVMLIKNMNIATDIKTIAIASTIQQIEIHPVYTTKIYLPVGAEILDLTPTVPFKVLEYSDNRAIIRPTSDFIAGDLDLVFLLNDKKYDITIFVKKYNTNNNNATNLFYPKIELAIEKSLSPSEVLQNYKNLYTKLPTDKLTYFTYKGLMYEIYLVDNTSSFDVEAIVGMETFRYKIKNGANR